MARRAFLARFSAAAAALALAPSATGVRAAGRDAVYERIWDVDQAANGVPAIAADQAGDPTRGFVKVDARPGRAPEHRLFAEVHIPACLTSAPTEQIEGFAERRISGSTQ